MFRNFSIRLMILLTVITGSVASFAQTSTDENEPQKVEFKYLGIYKDQPLFQLDFQNENRDKYRVTISDPQGIVLYAENGKAKTFSKKFLLNPTDLEDASKLFVEVIMGKDKPHVFTITRSTRFIEETSVSKL